MATASERWSFMPRLLSLLTGWSFMPRLLSLLTGWSFMPRLLSLLTGWSFMPRLLSHLTGWGTGQVKKTTPMEIFAENHQKWYAAPKEEIDRSKLGELDQKWHPRVPTEFSVARIGSSQWIGLLSAIEETPQPSTCVCESHVEAFVMKAEELMKKVPADMLEKMKRASNHKLHMNEEHVERAHTTLTRGLSLPNSKRPETTNAPQPIHSSVHTIQPSPAPMTRAATAPPPAGDDSSSFITELSEGFVAELSDSASATALPPATPPKNTLRLAQPTPMTAPVIQRPADSPGIQQPRPGQYQSERALGRPMSVPHTMPSPGTKPALRARSVSSQGSMSTAVPKLILSSSPVSTKTPAPAALLPISPMADSPSQIIRTKSPRLSQAKESQARSLFVVDVDTLKCLRPAALTYRQAPWNWREALDNNILKQTLAANSPNILSSHKTVTGSPSMTRAATRISSKRLRPALDTGEGLLRAFEEQRWIGRAAEEGFLQEQKVVSTRQKEMEEQEEAERTRRLAELRKKHESKQERKDFLEQRIKLMERGGGATLFLEQEQMKKELTEEPGWKRLQRGGPASQRVNHLDADFVDERNKVRSMRPSHAQRMGMVAKSDPGKKPVKGVMWSSTK
ncbi:hypothetical protein CYMTET_11283 [Cymbomonas tetramitiformis]|uniref:Uncharacterized protein n=1 Tax=Cymbomonas tetramitiformis TaxID=36881 RepID=A0AAE0GNZ1_9CHLO|nr:hypothetical protein CYMTET_11283 [Cymbomonas tetramitiformis]